MSTPLPDFSIPKDLPATLPLLVLRRGVLLPAEISTLTVGRERSLAALNAATDLILVGVQREPVADPSPADLLGTAVLARVLERKRTQRGVEVIVVQGLVRAQLTAFAGTHPYLEAGFVLKDPPWPDTPEADALRGVFVDEALGTAELLGGEARVKQVIRHFAEQGLLVDAVAAFVDSPDDAFKHKILLTADPMARANEVLQQLVRAREVIAARKAVQERVSEETRDMQRQFALRQQLEAIRKELGELGDDEDDDLARIKGKLAEKDFPEEAQRVIDRELRRLERINPNSPERHVALDWLERVADLPWGVFSAVDVDLTGLEKALENSHYGLEDVKRQVVEYLAVRKLAGSGRADVLLLVGPPGVGKTSIAQAIADATGRKLVRVALGGVRDEAELRGHRRTYIGARPGRIVEGFRQAGTADPVVLLDEVDKISASYMGNPAAALLEILDPEQNHAFTDHYLEMPFDLSKALFIGTANDLSQIPGPLRDRMEVLNIAGYTREEKRVIARRHLLERVARNAGLEPDDVRFTDEALDAAIAGWTREAGVRQLQRVLGKAYRAAAVRRARDDDEEPLQVTLDNLEELLGRRKFHDEDHEALSRPGIATGLAWTPVGGDVLYVEASTLPGRGQLVLTGQLGDVMKESARAALTYVLSHHQELGISADVLESQDVHIHVPAGGVPKDGPSAGVTMFTALASLLSGRSVRSDTAMTGEATLRGRVLPVGGIKSKVLAAHRRGMKRVILPRRNGADLEEVPDEALAELEVILVDHMDEVLKAALEVHDDLNRDAVAA